MSAATVGEVLRDLTARLGAVGIDTARLDARVLVGHVLGIEPVQVFSRPERRLSDEERGALEMLAARRERREPISHIIGHREFWSLRFKVTADTLDPRPDSETLIQAVLDLLPDRQAPHQILDFGTGTGCLLLALLSELPEAQGLGIDASEAALAVAQENAQGLSLAHRVEFRRGDWGRGLDGLFTVIIANPPYIPDDDIPGLEPEVGAFEPITALAGGADGLDCYRRLIPDMARLLAPGGIAALEVGRGQAAAVADILRRHDLAAVEMRQDLAGVERCVLGKRC